jgi:signal recognition particle GTPase
MIAFIRVNGIDKITSEAKLAFLFKTYSFNGFIIACDNFRFDAVV